MSKTSERLNDYISTMKSYTNIPEKIRLTPESVLEMLEQLRNDLSDDIDEYISTNEDKKTMELAQKIIYLMSGRPTYWDYYKDKYIEKEMLLKICRRCIKDNFPLEEYFLFDIPYRDEEGWVMTFVHTEDFDLFHNLRQKDTIREISFYCPFNSQTVTFDEDGDIKDYDTCFEAVRG